MSDIKIKSTMVKRTPLEIKRDSKKIFIEEISSDKIIPRRIEDVTDISDDVSIHRRIEDAVTSLDVKKDNIPKNEWGKGKDIKITSDKDVSQSINDIKDISIGGGILSNSEKSIKELGEKLSKLAKSGSGIADKILSTIDKDLFDKLPDNIKKIFESTGMDKVINTYTKKSKEPKFSKDQPLTELPRIIGLPPLPKNFLMRATGSLDVNLEAEMIKDTFPVLEIIPCHTQGKAGLDAYRLIPSWGSDRKPTAKETAAMAAAHKKGKSKTDTSILTMSFVKSIEQYYKVKIPPSPGYLRVCYLAESPVSEAFSNDFGENIFSTMAAGASNPMVRQMAQMLGVTDIASLTNKLKSFAGKIPGVSDKMIKGIEDKTTSATSKSPDMLKTIGKTIASSLLGHGIDFPQVWQTSNFSPSYSFTVRLYNPLVGDAESTRKYIYAPLAVLMSFIVPRSYDGHFFFAPWFCKFRVKGLIPEYSGYIKNISVIKGGDNNQIGWNQKVGIVDLKIDFGILYKSMVAGKEFADSENPQLATWLKEFLVNKGWESGSDKNTMDNISIPKWYAVGSDKSKDAKDAVSLLGKNKSLNSILGGVTSVNPARTNEITSGLRETLDRTTGVINQLLGKEGLISDIGNNSELIDTAIKGLSDVGQYTWDKITELEAVKPPQDPGMISKNPDPTKGIPVVPVGTYESEVNQTAYA